MRFKRHLKLETVILDIAPLIDVIFLLLIFFMLTSTFIIQGGIKVNLPKALTGEAIHDEQLVINVTAEDVIYLNDKVVTLSDLEYKLAELAHVENKQLLIKSDRRASLGRVVQIWDMCRKIGISKVNLATDKPR